MTHMICVSFWYNRRMEHGIGIGKSHERHILGTLPEIIERLRAYCDNVDAITIDRTVNGVSINTDDRLIFQVCGYSDRRGAYRHVTA